MNKRRTKKALNKLRQGGPLTRNEFIAVKRYRRKQFYRTLLAIRNIPKQLAVAFTHMAGQIKKVAGAFGAFHRTLETIEKEIIEGNPTRPDMTVGILPGPCPHGHTYTDDCPDCRH